MIKEPTTPVAVKKGMHGWFWHPEHGIVPATIFQIQLRKNCLWLQVVFGSPCKYFELPSKNFQPKDY